jgi:hypothetical protein
MADLKKNSPLKSLGQMNRNLVRIIYGTSSMKIAHFLPLANEKLLERASDNDLLLCRKSTSNKTRYSQ